MTWSELPGPGDGEAFVRASSEPPRLRACTHSSYESKETCGAVAIHDDALSSMSSSVPTVSSMSCTVLPSHVKFSENYLRNLEKGVLPSKGTLDHSVIEDKCFVCVPFQQNRCPRGTHCHRCHSSEHPLTASSNGGGSKRQRAALQRGSIRRIRTPERWAVWQEDAHSGLR